VKKAVRALGAVMEYVGTLGLVTPTMCMALFYTPKKPAALE